jgi:methionine-rich copper-binding protein CopC
MHGKATISALALGLAVVASANDAAAHARLVSSVPAESATAAAPKALTLRFSEGLVPKFSGVDLMKADGSMVAVKPAPTPDAKSMTVILPAPLPAGSYMVMWHAAADDGHRTTGQYNFTVR